MIKTFYLILAAFLFLALILLLKILLIEIAIYKSAKRGGYKYKRKLNLKRYK